MSRHNAKNYLRTANRSTKVGLLLRVKMLEDEEKANRQQINFLIEQKHEFLKEINNLPWIIKIFIPKKLKSKEQ